MKIYVGDLPYAATEEEVLAAFKNHGAVGSVAIIKDKFTGKSKGFGFVEMSNDEEAKAAMTALDGTDFKGRKIRVNEARPKPERSGGDRGGRDRDHRGGGGGGGRRSW